MRNFWNSAPVGCLIGVLVVCLMISIVYVVATTVFKEYWALFDAVVTDLMHLLLAVGVMGMIVAAAWKRLVKVAKRVRRKPKQKPVNSRP